MGTMGTPLPDCDLTSKNKASNTKTFAAAKHAPPSLFPAKGFADRLQGTGSVSDISHPSSCWAL